MSKHSFSIAKIIPCKIQNIYLKIISHLKYICSNVRKIYTISKSKSMFTSWSEGVRLRANKRRMSIT